MKVITVEAESKPSRILIGESLSNVLKYIKDRKTIILTDSNIIKYYKEKFPQKIPVIEMGLGEKHKTLETLDFIMGKNGIQLQEIISLI